MSWRSVAGLLALTALLFVGMAALDPVRLDVLALLTVPLPLIAVLGLGLAVAFSRANVRWFALGAAGLAALVLASIAPSLLQGLPSLAAIVLLGVVLIVGRDPPAWLAVLFGLASGAVAATAVSAAPRTWGGALGVAVAAVVVAGWLAIAVGYARTLPLPPEAVPIARRVAGAWGVAIALLLARYA
jgi:hypothetical protein